MGGRKNCVRLGIFIAVLIFIASLANAPMDHVSTSQVLSDTQMSEMKGCCCGCANALCLRSRCSMIKGACTCSKCRENPDACGLD